MKLFLASEAKNPLTIKKLKEYIGGFQGKRLAYIPTAANAEGWGSWRGGGSWSLVQTLETKLTLIQLEEYQLEDIVKDLKDKDIIWFAGGYSGYLMYWIRRTQLDKTLKNLLDKNILYVGSSAGSMITSKTLEVSEWYIGGEEHGVNVLPGLGLVDFHIYPHFKDEQFEEIKDKYKGKKMYMLKDGEEIIVENNSIQVIGEERIIGK